MKEHWKLKDFGVTILFSLFYFVIVLAATVMGGIHPLLYLFVISLVALLAWIPYFYVATKYQKPGVALIMNLFVALGFAAAGELANLLLVSLVVCAIIAEIVRRISGYKNYKGLVVSYIMLVLGNIGSPLYVWVYPQYAVSEASEEMSVSYAEKLSGLTSLWWMAAAILVAIVVGVIAGCIAKKVYKKRIGND